MFSFDKRVEELSEKALVEAKNEFQVIDEITEYNQKKWIKVLGFNIVVNCFTIPYHHYEHIDVHTLCSNIK